MSKMFKIALPDGSVREVPEGSTPARCRRGDRAGAGQGRAGGAGRWRIARPQPPVRGRCEPGAGHRARREGRARAGPPRLRARPCRGGAEAVSRARRSPSARRPTTASITTSPRRRAAACSPTRSCPRIEEEMRRIIAADEPLIREEWSREDVRAFFERTGRNLQGRMGDGAARGRGDHHVSLAARATGVDGPVPRAASGLDRQARPAGVQADARVGRLLARRPGQSDAQPDLRHRLAQQEAARRASRPAGGSGQARPSPHRPGHGPVPPPGRGAWQRLLAPQGLHPVAPARGLYAPPPRRRRL